MQNDLISRQSLMAHFEVTQDLVNERDLLYCNGVLAVIEREPSVDAVPVVHARWNRVFEDWRHQMAGNECSACRFVLYGPVGSYCPNCGSKMDGDAE